MTGNRQRTQSRLEANRLGERAHAGDFYQAGTLLGQRAMDVVHVGLPVTSIRECKPELGAACELPSGWDEEASSPITVPQHLYGDVGALE
jgi:hypothetical protein